MRILDHLRPVARAVVGATVLALLSLCLSCASLMPQFNGPTCDRGTIPEFQHAYSKKPSDCLAVCVDMVLNYYGVATIVPDTSLPLDLISLTRSLNTDTPVDEAGHVLFATALELTPAEMAAHLAKQRPLIVAFKPSARKEYHSVVVSGFCAENERYFVHDPARRRPTWKKLSRIPTFEDSGKHLVLLVGLSEK